MTKPSLESVATPAGRELDGLVHAHVMGREHRRCEHPMFTFDNALFYTTDPEAFFAVLERVKASGWGVSIWTEGDSWTANLFRGRFEEETVEADAPTLPLALARAAMMTTYQPEGKS